MRNNNVFGKIWGGVKRAFSYIGAFLKKNWKFSLLILVVLMCFGSYKYGYMKGREGKSDNVRREVSREKSQQEREQNKRSMYLGEVKEISDEKIVIVQRGGEEKEIDVRGSDDIKVQSGTKEVKYEEIKVGDNLIIYTRGTGDDYKIERIRVR